MPLTAVVVTAAAAVVVVITAAAAAAVVVAAVVVVVVVVAAAAAVPAATAVVTEAAAVAAAVAHVQYQSRCDNAHVVVRSTFEFLLGASQDVLAVKSFLDATSSQLTCALPRARVRWLVCIDTHAQVLWAAHAARQRARAGVGRILPQQPLLYDVQGAPVPRGRGRAGALTAPSQYASKLYLLVTDVGYQHVQSVVWECLDEIDGAAAARPPQL